MIIHPWRAIVVGAVMVVGGVVMLATGTQIPLLDSSGLPLVVVGAGFLVTAIYKLIQAGRRYP